jgi:signal transduction histidine kinase
MIESTISIQALGVGIAAFVATLSAAFLFINAWKEHLARSFGYAMAAAALWGWVGFASTIALEHEHLALARELRIVSIAGNVLLAILFVRFARIYKSERVATTKREQATFDIFVLTAAAFVVLLCMDLLFGSAIMIGPYLVDAVTPLPGPMMPIFQLYYILCIVLIYIFMRSRVAIEDSSSRRGHVILLYAMTVGASCGIGGFFAWYGIYVPGLSVIRALAVPLLALGSFYAMTSHNIFNVRVAAANVFVFAIWSFLFFRILLNASLSDSFADVLLLGALIILGVLLIRSFNTELEDRIFIERAERERAIEQSKTEFISIAAHQLRTPLSGIRWTFNVLDSAKGLTEEQRDLVKRASDRTKDVIDRVNEMLNAARFTDGGFAVKLETQDVRPVLRESIALFEDAAKAHKLKLESSLPRKSLMSRVDKDKFGMAIQNLIDNSIKYTKSGTVSLVASQEGDRIVIRISDTGIGIAGQDTKHIFEKFYRHEKAVKMFTDGSGLGLFIVKKIIDAHGGTIMVISEKGKGTSMTLSIPAVVSAR